MIRKTALTIAGSDSSGGAGIQADLKTMTALGVYGMSAITALTAQNTQGVFGISEVDPSFLEKQLDCIFEDIYPDSVKIGMVSSSKLIEVIANNLEKYKAKNIIIDPVMVSTSGSKLLKEDAIQKLQERLFPLASLLTPNIPEAIILSGLNIENEKDMEKAGQQISSLYNTSVLLKGGHQIYDANDYLYTPQGGRWFYAQRVDNSNCHGTGCTLSSAIASYLALGMDLENAILNGKNFVSAALSSMLDLGKASGPVDHMWNIDWRKNETI